MRLTLSFIASLATAVGLPCLGNEGSHDDAVAARFHCAGGSELMNEGGVATFRKGMAFPSFAPVQKLIVTRMAAFLADGLRLRTNAAASLEPLLSDLASTESLGSFGGGSTDNVSFVLALKVNSDRAKLWSSNLSDAIGSAGEKLNVDGLEGRRWNAGLTNEFWLIPAHDWLVLGRGTGLSQTRDDYLQQLTQHGRPAPALSGSWLEGDVDCARLPELTPDWLRLLRPARVDFRATTESNNFRLTAKVLFPESVAWQMQPWNLPTNLVSEPLISFTAAQNIESFVNLAPIFSKAGDDPFTNQFYVWAQKGLPFLTYMAWPVSNAPATLDVLSSNAPDAFNTVLKEFNGTELVWQSERSKLALANLRIIVPTLEAVEEEKGEFLLASLFPRAPASRPASEEMWKQITGRTNLVYYDWEATGDRLQQWRMLGKMLLTRSRKPTRYVMGARLNADKWLNDVVPLLGNTVTEVTRVSPAELSVVRNAPIGFTGIEMFLLSEWLARVGAPVEYSSPAPSFP